MQPLGEMLHKHRVQAVRMLIHRHVAPMFALSSSVALQGCTADRAIVPRMPQALEGAMHTLRAASLSVHVPAMAPRAPLPWLHARDSLPHGAALPWAPTTQVMVTSIPVV